MRTLIAGAGGFIGGHLTKRLLDEGFSVVAVDKKPLNEWYQTFNGAENKVLDLSNILNCEQTIIDVDWVFNLAADMGGMGFIENNKALCMLSVLINTNLLLVSKQSKVKKYFFASSACVYPGNIQNLNVNRSISLRESDAYPADPEDGYGWEKLFSERMCNHFFEDFGLEVRVARYHNVYGPFGTFYGGREKAPAAAARKVLEFKRGLTNEIEIWGDGSQLRSFTYIDDCIDGTLKLMKSNFRKPMNIGSSETVSITELYDFTAQACEVDAPKYSFKLDAPIGVKGRSSNNNLCLSILNWQPSIKLSEGIRKTVEWISSQSITNS
jgi:nucleoside-diphosphate-sugar epimerase